MKWLHNRQSMALAVVAVAASAALAGCGSSTTQSTTTATSTSTTTAPATSSPSSMEATVDLKTAKTSLGEIVTDGKGMTLYYYTKDTKGSGVSACTGGCLDAWPIAVALGDKPVADPSVTGTLGTIDSPDGKKQLTLNGMPLYYFAQDMAPGDVLGQDVNEVWYVVAPDGTMITEAPGK